MSNEHEDRRSDSNHSSESPDDRIHRFVGEYELLDVVGRGGMGVVHRARHRELGHIVALKFLGPGRQADLVEIGRFRREAEALSHLDHPRIVPISSFGNHEGRPYFTMPLCDYGSLDQQLSRFTHRPREAARIVREAARGVHHAHQWGILHRNLKPSKILLDERGEPRVADFGLARMLGEPCDLTPTGNILGSLPYVSPEACLGRAEEVNTLSDGYGLGAILYALSTAQAPFGSSSTAVTIERIVIDDPPPPRRTHPGIPRDLETICLKCLENSQADRYDSAYALADDLGRFLEGYPIEGRRVGGLRRLQLWTARRP
ncbi:MAG: serine/threonine-protein kinase [Isosphaeraceae bacterium]|nr:serine/threonine-protein kinase [Isosphaeraceae bacterium]